MAEIKENTEMEKQAGTAEKTESERQTDAQQADNAGSSAQQADTLSREPEKDTVNDADSIEEKLKFIREEDAKGESLSGKIQDILERAGGIQTVNFVIAGEISHSSLFENNGQEHGTDEEPVFCLTDEKEFRKFMHRRGDSILLLYLLAAVCLGVVENNQMDLLAGGFKRCLDVEEERFEQNRGASISEIAEHLNAQKAVIWKNTEAGKLEFNGLGYSKEDLKKLRSLLWTDYPQYREPIINWLFSLNDLEMARASYFARNAIAALARLDFAYAHEHIILRLAAMEGTGKISLLGTVLLQLAGDGDKRVQVQNMARHWAGLLHSNNWLACVYLWLNDPELLEEDGITRRLAALFKRESVYHKREAYRYLAILLRGYGQLARLIYKALMEAFDGMDGNEKKILCRDWLALLADEVFLVNYNPPMLCLLGAFEEEEVRKLTKPFFRFLWADYYLRHLLSDTLDTWFLRKKVRDRLSAESVFLFFRTLAFTGKKTDFDNMTVYLQRSATGERLRIKKEILDWLMEQKNRIR